MERGSSASTTSTSPCCSSCIFFRALSTGMGQISPRVSICVCVVFFFFCMLLLWHALGVVIKLLD